LYFIKNLEDFQNIPELFKDEVFTHAFQIAELAKMDREDWERYEYSLKVFRDNKATYDYAVETAHEEGLLKGMQEGLKEGLKRDGERYSRREKVSKKVWKGYPRRNGERHSRRTERGQRNIARQAKMMGLDIASIQKLTGLSEEEITNL
jgi:predicted transposase/invertase (TIGR01784 family)